MLKVIAPKNGILKGKLNIPASKSISNRVLIIQALCKEKIELENLSISDDTKILTKALSQVKAKTAKIIDVGMAGTSFRFLTAFLSVQKGEFILTGSSRIKKRPIKPLVDALLSIGADIEYLEEEGFAPLKIIGKELESKTIQIDSSISSQFITALILIAPKIKNGLNIELVGEIASLPYLRMTLNLLNYFGIKANLISNKIQIQAGNYIGKGLFIEADWSSASYFYESLALSKSGELFLENYSKNSIQGDSKLVDVFKKFGVETEFKENGILLKKNIKGIVKFFKYNFINEPDLAQTIIVTCATLDIEGEFLGLESLKIKETDRVLAIKTEINKIAWDLIENNKVYSLQKIKVEIETKEIVFNTYNDHRMAMCLAPLSLKYSSVNIENSNVVSKSNPLFWEQFETIGFKLKIIKN